MLCRCALHHALKFNGDVQSYDARSSKHFVDLNITSSIHRLLNVGRSGSVVTAQDW